jgi:hypothetical protein
VVPISVVPFWHQPFQAQPSRWRFSTPLIADPLGGKLTLNDLGNFGEFVGAIAVVVSLIYLAVQIRQNTRSVRAAVYQEVSREASDMLRTLITDERVGSAFVLGLGSPENLDSGQRYIFDSVMNLHVRNIQNAFFQNRAALVQPELFESFVSYTTPIVLSSRGAKDWWQRNRQHFAPDFRAWLESRLAAQQADVAQRDAIDL